MLVATIGGSRAARGFIINRTFSSSLVVQTYPLYKSGKAWHSALEHVSAMPPAEEGRKGTPLLQRRGKPPAAIRPSGPAPRAVSGGDQRLPAGGLAQNSGGVRRTATACDDAPFVPGRPSSASRCLGYDPSQVERNAVAACAAVRQLLVGLRVVAATGTGPVLGADAAARARRGELAAGAH